MRLVRGLVGTEADVPIGTEYLAVSELGGQFGRDRLHRIAVGDLDVTASVDAAMEAVTPVVLVSPAVRRAGARRPGAGAEMSARP